MNSESQPKVNFLPRVKWVEKILQLLTEYPWPSQNTRDFETACFDKKGKTTIKPKLVWKPIVFKNKNAVITTPPPLKEISSLKFC